MVDEEKSKVIAQIKEGLKLKGQTQKAFCSEIGISPRHLSSVLRKKKGCTLDTYYKYLNFIKNSTKK